MTEFALIPAYNEEKNILEVLRRLKKVNHLIPLVIDDGSKDKTAELARKNGAIVLRHKRNKGKGEAIRTGFEYILKKKDAKYVVIVDSDLQFLPEESAKILKALKKGSNFVIGYRNFSKIPFANRIGNHIWVFTFNLLFGTDIKDTNSGFIGMDIKTIKLIKNNVGGGYIIDNGLRAAVVKHKLKIKHVPVTIVYHGKREIRRLARMLVGNFFYIIKEGLKYRFSLEN
ncbi:MAG: glycosyltransferase family 2 protein [Candidatus Aenigmarchaeota archaeon]|nr:glycosyltransferase family 2 protein [Candidatus Aenigmarchaeota archaeon]